MIYDSLFTSLFTFINIYQLIDCKQTRKSSPEGLKEKAIFTLLRHGMFGL